MKGSLFILLIIAIFGGTWIVAQTELSQDQEQRIQRLEKIIQDQQERIQTLQDRVNESKTAPQIQAKDQSHQYAEKVAEDYLKSPDTQQQDVQFGYEGGKGFFLRVPKFELYMSGVLQMGIGIFENDTPDDNSVYPNGVNIANDIYLYTDWHARIQVNFHSSIGGVGFQGSVPFDRLELWDAYVEYLGFKDEFDNPMAALRIGQTHVPFTIQGQYGSGQSVDIWGGGPFISAWSHGRDPGIMLWGLLSDMVEYKLSVHNGEGRSNTNASDDFLMAAGLRIYPLTHKANPNTFLHIGVIRSRDDNPHGFGNVASASLRTPWGRPVFDNVFQTSTTQGWRTGVDVGLRLDVDLGDDKLNHLRMDTEFMYITWERSLATGRLPFLEGFGFSWNISFRHNFTPEVDGAGLFPVFTFSYSDVDSKDTDSTLLFADIPGQRVWTYTAGLGYAFNSHISAQFNWVMVNLDELDIYNSGNAARDDRPDGSDDTEHAWFFQVTAMW